MIKLKDCEIIDIKDDRGETEGCETCGFGSVEYSHFTFITNNYQSLTISIEGYALNYFNFLNILMLFYYEVDYSDFTLNDFRKFFIKHLEFLGKTIAKQEGEKILFNVYYTFE